MPNPSLDLDLAEVHDLWPPMDAHRIVVAVVMLQKAVDMGNRAVVAVVDKAFARLGFEVGKDVILVAS